jgi:hypothetical protein
VVKDKLSDIRELAEPDAEDCGWYSELTWEGRKYLIGSVALWQQGDDPKGEIEWVFHVDKSRSLKEKLFGREKMTTGDSCFQFFKSIFENEPQITNIDIG